MKSYVSKWVGEKPPTRTCRLARLIFEITHLSGSFEKFIWPEAGSGGIRRSQCHVMCGRDLQNIAFLAILLVTFLGWLHVPLNGCW